MTRQEVQAQIEAQTTGVEVKFYQDRLLLIEATPSSGVGIDKDGTANPDFGYPTNADFAGTVFAPPDGTAPRLVNIFTSPINPDVFFIVTEE